QIRFGCRGIRCQLAECDVRFSKTRLQSDCGPRRLACPADGTWPFTGWQTVQNIGCLDRKDGLGRGIIRSRADQLSADLKRAKRVLPMRTLEQGAKHPRPNPRVPPLAGIEGPDRKVPA